MHRSLPWRRPAWPRCAAEPFIAKNLDLDTSKTTQDATTDQASNSSDQASDIEGTYRIDATITEWTIVPSAGMEPVPSRAGQVITGTVAIQCESAGFCSVVPKGANGQESVFPPDRMRRDGNTLTYFEEDARIGSPPCRFGRAPDVTGTVTVEGLTLTGSASYSCPGDRTFSYEVTGQQRLRSRSAAEPRTAIP